MRRRRSKLVILVAAGVASVLAVSLGQTSAYFTGAVSSAMQTAVSATLPAPASLSLTKTGSTAGQSTSVSWGAPATRPWQASAGTGGAIEYTVARNTVDAFGPSSGAVQVYRGTGTSTTDSSGSAPVSLASQVVGFPRMDANAALINGVPYRWGLAFRINTDRSESRGSIWQGASGQPEFNTGVLTEMQFANSSEKEELTSLAPGRDHICALSVTKKVFCMGFGLLGQTGLSTDQNSTNSASVVQWNRLQDPRGVFTGKSIIQITSGEMFSCALASDGTIGCWGINDTRQLGNGGYTGASLGAPIKVAQANGSEWPAFSVNKPILLAAGASHVCAVKGNGPDGAAPTSPVACWGKADQSQLGGFNTATSSAEPRDVADPDGVLTGVTAITAGNDATCVINDRTQTTNVACWGWGGLLGRSAGASAPANSASPAAIQSSVTGFSAVDLSNGHACGAAGTSVVCWGNNSFTKLGNSSSPNDAFYLPSTVVDTDGAFQGQRVISVGAGWSHSCAALERGTIACWGLGAQFQLGQGSSATDGNGNGVTAKPVTIQFGGTKMKAQGADLLADGSGGRYTLARINGSYYNWGTNGSSGANKPAIVTGYPTNISRMAAGYDHACAITGVDSKIYCSGGNGNGQLGNGTTTGSVGTAIQVSDPEGVFAGKTVIDVTASWQATCALTSDGIIGCWGQGANGQLTQRSSGNSSTPLRIGTGANGTTPYAALTGAASPVSISGGNGFFCARTAISVACWGQNDLLQLGRTTSGTFDAVPAAVSGSNLSSSVTGLDSGFGGSCAVKADTTAYCWGRGDQGNLGQGSSNSATPLRAAGSGYASISVGWSVCAAMVQSEAPKCWGRDGSGQMGRGSVTSGSGGIATVGSTLDPDGDFARSGVVSIYSGDEMHCALTGSGRLYCWGWGSVAQTAQDGSTSHVLTPTLAQISAGVTVTGAAKVCLDGAVLSSSSGAFTCSLVPSRTYYYQVTYTVSNVPNWVSARQVASR